MSRPSLHLTSGTGWINDPLGLTWDDGTYHLFFQHVPDGTVWDPGCSWGRATSTDLLHWTEQPVALAPGDGDQGCWSGSVALPDPGRPVVFYTSVGPPDLALGTVRTARPAAGAGWTGWTKGEVLVRPPAGVEVAVFRDPFVLRDGDGWRMLVGAGFVDGTAAVLGYASDDLLTWTCEGVAASRPTTETEPAWTGAAWECPQLFPLGDRWVLLVSVWDRTPREVAYAVGTWADGRFTAGTWRRLTWGGTCYAPTVFVDRDGQRGVVHWLRGVDDPEAGWAGALSVPHRLTLAGDVLQVQPHPAVDALRRPVADPARLPDGPTDLLWQVAAGGPLRLHRGDGRVVVELALAAGLLEVRVAGDEAADDAERAIPCPGGEVRVLADGPVVEVFTGPAVLAARVPAGPGALRPLDPRDGAVTCWSLAPSA